MGVYNSDGRQRSAGGLLAGQAKGEGVCSRVCVVILSSILSSMGPLNVR
jgi:hypothetical protein